MTISQREFRWGFWYVALTGIKYIENPWLSLKIILAKAPQVQTKKQTKTLWTLGPNFLQARPRPWKHLSHQEEPSSEVAKEEDKKKSFLSNRGQSKEPWRDTNGKCFPRNRTRTLSRNIPYPQRRSVWKHLPSEISELLWTSDSYLYLILLLFKWEHLFSHSVLVPPSYVECVKADTLSFKFLEL